MEQRSTSRSISSEDLVIGVIRAPHGVPGEVKVESRTDVPGRFKKGSRLRCDDVGELVVASVRGTADVPIVRFEGRTTREDDELLRGKRLRVSRADASRSGEGAYLWAGLRGLDAEAAEGQALGDG